MQTTLTDHVVNPANDRLKIEVLDEPSQGGACHLYRISGYDLTKNPSAKHSSPARLGMGEGTDVLFQNGPIDADGNGINGLTHEVLLAILVHRLQGFQAGKYACRENALALTHLQDAQHWLAHRTRARMARGVEGSHEV